MKYRRNKVKREHGIIQNALLWLENLGCLPEVTDIIPGVIEVSHSSERGIVYKYETQTGCKLLLKSNGSIQEVFVVTKIPARVEEWVKKEFPPDSPPTVAQMVSASDLQALSKKKLPSVQQKSRRNDEHKKLPCGKISGSGNCKTPNVAAHLDRITLKALKDLKQSLENAKIQNANMKQKKNGKDEKA